MHTQRDLFSPMCGVTRTKQSSLFDVTGHGREATCECQHCGRPLVETASGFWTCPAGCQKLQALGDADPQDNGPSLY